MVANGEPWAKEKVENLAEYITVGFVGSMSSLFVEEGVPLLRGQNIHPYSLDLSNLKYISQETHRKWKKSALKPGDVVIVRVGYPGTACVIPEGVGDLNAASLVIVRPNPALLDSKFLSYVINSPWGKAQVAGRLVGSAQQVFNTQTAAELEIPAPPLPVQRRIAGILSAYDELIENSQRRIKILEAMARALYREWFVHFRFPGHESVPRVPSPVGEIPNGWEVKRVPDCVHINPRVTVPRDGEKPFVPMGCLSNDSMIISNIESRAGNSGAKFQNGDTLFARITPCLENGKTGFVQFLPDTDAVAFGSTEFIVLRSHTLTREFVYCLARSDEFRGVAIKSMSGATGRQRVQEQCFDDFQIAQPPRALLDEFSAIVAPSFYLVYRLHLQIQNLRHTRDLLLPRLLSGQIDVANLPEPVAA
ncbi:MAG: restriction endonuclease subunit S [Accumulibacter sp.]|jgi:type I restriction enzyme S subunit